MVDEQKPGETPAPAPVTGTEPPKEPKVETAEELKARLAEVERQLANKKDEAERLHKKTEKYEKEEADRLKAQMTELERANAERDEAKRLLGELQIKETKRAIAEKTGLPLSFADRLQGATPDELEADAKKLLEAMPKPKIQPIGPTSPADGQAPGETIDQRRARLRGGGVDIFNPDVAKQYGGGVLPNSK